MSLLPRFVFYCHLEGCVTMAMCLAKSPANRNDALSLSEELEKRAACKLLGWENGKIDFILMCRSSFFEGIKTLCAVVYWLQ